MKLIYYFLTTIYFVLFGLYLIIFHPLQYISYKLGGRRLQKKTVGVLSTLLSKSTIVAGVKTKYINFENLPQNRPIIIVANHHSLHDITNIGCIFRGKDIAFVSKAELGKEIPSISYNLRASGSALINRRDRKQSISEILRLAKQIEENKSIACIFPEGTRKHNSDLLREFKTGGTAALIKKAPSAVVIPVAISGTWKLKFPYIFGTEISFERLTDIEPSEYDNYEDVVLECQNQIHKAVKID